MTLRVSLLMLTLLPLFLQCTKASVEPGSDAPGQFVFGSFFGFCQGEGCIEIFKVERGQLYEDQRDQYPAVYGTEPYEGSYALRSSADYALAADLPGQLPEALFDEEEQVLGIPDAGDWGGWYVARRPAGGAWEWRYIDNNLSNVPSYLHGFVEEMRRTVDALQE